LQKKACLHQGGGLHPLMWVEPLMRRDEAWPHEHEWAYYT
jgi:hypothetical protein